MNIVLLIYYNSTFTPSNHYNLTKITFNTNDDRLPISRLQSIFVFFLTNLSH